jgi:GNAT superfamily N-acetyltransferase/predicted nucleic acid-binding protein
VRVERIDRRSPHLTAVKVLGDASRETLGFFPEGAFEAYAERKLIAVALDEADQCIGYVLFRPAARRRDVDIVHLCVQETRRREGVATALVDWLRKATERDYAGMRLKCRRGYAARHLWPRLGFRAVGDVRGRSAEGHPLTVWRLDYGHRDLLSGSPTTDDGPRLRIVLDANVLFALQDPNDTTRQESMALLADWVGDEIVLGVTDEVFNEIDRNEDRAERRRRRSFAEQFERFASVHEDWRELLPRLRVLFSPPLSDSDESDARQLAHAIAASVPYFVTHDRARLAE